MGGRSWWPPLVSRLNGKSGIVAFDADPANGDVLAADYVGGKILRLTAGKPGASFPQKLSDTRLFTRTNALWPASSVHSYTFNEPARNDHAVSRHWFAVPDMSSHIEGLCDGNWSFPTGMIWMQHLPLETELGNPKTSRRIETRLLVKNEAGTYGVTYRWNEEGTKRRNPELKPANSTADPLDGGAIWRSHEVFTSQRIRSFHLPLFVDGCQPIHHSQWIDRWPMPRPSGLRRAGYRQRRG